MGKKSAGFSMEVYAKVKGPDGKYCLVKQPSRGQLHPKSKMSPEARAKVLKEHAEFLAKLKRKAA